jgi:hypothetical protein
MQCNFYFTFFKWKVSGGENYKYEPCRETHIFTQGTLQKHVYQMYLRHWVQNDAVIITNQCSSKLNWLKLAARYSAASYFWLAMMTFLSDCSNKCNLFQMHLMYQCMSAIVFLSYYSKNSNTVKLRELKSVDFVVQRFLEKGSSLLIQFICINELWTSVLLSMIM